LSTRTGEVQCLTASTTASQGRCGRLSSVQALLKPSSRAKSSEPSEGPHEVDLGTGRSKEHGDEQADGPRPEDQGAIAGTDSSRLSRAQRVAAGLDERAQHRIDGIG
jgi:hypothetical protein